MAVSQPLPQKSGDTVVIPSNFNIRSIEKEIRNSVDSIFNVRYGVVEKALAVHDNALSLESNSISRASKLLTIISIILVVVGSVFTGISIFFGKKLIRSKKDVEAIKSTRTRFEKNFANAESKFKEFNKKYESYYSKMDKFIVFHNKIETDIENFDLNFGIVSPPQNAKITLQKKAIQIAIIEQMIPALTDKAKLLRAFDQLYTEQFLSCLETLSDITVKDALVLFVSGYAYYKLENYDVAKIFFQKCLEMDNEFYVAHSLLKEISSDHRDPLNDFIQKAHKQFQYIEDLESGGETTKDEIENFYGLMQDLKNKVNPNKLVFLNFRHLIFQPKDINGVNVKEEVQNIFKINDTIIYG